MCGPQWGAEWSEGAADGHRKVPAWCPHGGAARCWTQGYFPGGQNEGVGLRPSNGLSGSLKHTAVIPSQETTLNSCLWPLP